MFRAALLLCLPALLAAQSRIRPPWVNLLPNEPGRVHALGVASLQGAEAQALRLAQDHARGEVVARLRAQVKSQSESRSTSQVHRSTTGPTTGTAERIVTQQTSVTAQALDLPGLRVEETWVDAPAGVAYALACLDVATAEGELRNRFEAQRSVGAAGAPSGAPRERLRHLQGLRSAQAELERLDDLAGLLAAAGGESQLRLEVRRARLGMDERLDRLRAGLTFSLEAEPGLDLGQDLEALLRNAVLKQGLGWAATGKGEFTLRLRARTRSATTPGVPGTPGRARPWTTQVDTTFTVVRGVVELSLADGSGTAFESTALAAKGVGATEFQAERSLLDAFHQQLGSTLERWLKDLTR